MSCDGGHLGFPIGIKNSNLVKDIQMIIHLQFGSSQFISFREEGLWNFSQSERIIGPGSHIEYPTGTKNRDFVEDHPRNIPVWTIAITWRPSSVVFKLFTFQASSPKPLGRLETNLAGMFLGWSSTKSLFFVPVGYSIWLPGPIICSDWLKFQRPSSLKLMNWLNPNCKWMIIGMSFTKLLFFMPIGNPRWPPSQDID
jgi:hypothetical protein